MSEEMKNVALPKDLYEILSMDATEHGMTETEVVELALWELMFGDMEEDIAA